MGEETKQIQGKLQEPFAETELEWRVQRGGIKKGKPWAIIVPYVTNRAIQNRLDDVFDIGDWWNQYDKGPDGGVICGITCVINGNARCKWGGAENTKIEPVKGGLSNSMKRAAVQWGIGRYLYTLPVMFAGFPEKGKGQYNNKLKDEKDQDHWIYWNPPMLPEWAVANSEKGSPVQWAYDHPAIKKICQDMGLNQSGVADAVFAGNFEVKKVLTYLHALEDAKFEEEKK